MKLVTFMRDLVAKGMSWEDAATFAERFEDGLEEALVAAAPKRSANAVRQARFRARSVTQSVTSNATNNVTPPKDVSPTPPSENPSLPKGPLKGPQKVSVPTAAQPEKPTSEPAKALSAWVSEIWDNTPRPGRVRSGRSALERSLRAAIRRGADPARIASGLRGYYASEDATKDHGKYAKGVDSAISSGRWEAFDALDDGPPPDDDPWTRRLLNFRVNQYWNTEWGPKPGKPGYQGPQTESLAA